MGSQPTRNDDVTFRRHTIYEGHPAERMSCVVGDLDNDGVPEFIISTRNPEQLHWFGRTGSGTWEPHLMDDTFASISVGGVLVDLTGNGRLDLIAATSDKGNFVYWWECPEDPADPWVRREVFRLPGNRTHDLMVADIDRDGRQELFVWNQDAETLFWVAVPDNPRATPWPDFKPVVTGLDEQALAAADVDGDGQLELIARCSWYRLFPDGTRKRHVYTEDYGGTRIVTADFDGDGRTEIAVCEVGADIGQPHGRLALFRPGSDPENLWEAQAIHDRVLDAHSLQVADFDGDSSPDFYVGEMGLSGWTQPNPPVQRIFLSRGDSMEEHINGTGVGTHEAQVIELDGKFGIVSKPYRSIQDSAPRPEGVDNLYLYLPE
jgi:hypothetical protein